MADVLVLKAYLPTSASFSGKGIAYKTHLGQFKLLSIYVDFHVS